MATRGAKLDDQGRALLREDLRSPCAEEVAVFHAFARTVSEARTAFVILDTASTGHTPLLMDATGAYHRQIIRDFDRHPIPGRIITRLQDPLYTQLIPVSLPEITPVSEAAALQEDLRRAKIEPFAWVINRSLLASGTQDPLLRERLIGECKQTERVRRSFAQKTFIVPWQATPIVPWQATPPVDCQPSSSSRPDAPTRVKNISLRYTVRSNKGGHGQANPHSRLVRPD